MTVRTIAWLAVTLSLASCGSNSDGTSVPEEVGFSAVRALSDHREVDVTWQNEGISLSGTLFLPLNEGLYPAIVFHFGSNRWTRAEADYPGFTKPWLDNGIAALAYDKRGVGQSGGECCPFSEPGYFELLGTDLVAAINTLQSFPEVDPNRIGIWGFSQGGWVAPTAAASSPSVAFTVIGSGPVVTLGEELLYSELTGESACLDSGLSDDEIDEQLNHAGPSGFDPRPHIENMFNPGYWFYGELDRSVPVGRSISILEDIRDTYGNPIEIRLVPNANHVMIIGGGICQATGRTADVLTPVFQWLATVLERP